ncbi:DMT family transporter [Desulfovibrio legallii]|uniref:Permease of the drug/metabolite transporter (DMT) superfamily n=1 Tax=Desulfovibrio legallii TaxID=571438 RepID=A0A1G7KER3_9BACT|nr:EamA family transporter [Desulfovibrio legallii]SDF35672.1 Permease of the drug/metabolite transporter (DMT) superfamily [Desulfovibrio legallii]
MSQPPAPALSRHAALVRMHAATVLFGVSGILGKLCQSSAPVLVCGRALFAVAALGLICLSRRETPWRGLNRRDAASLALSGALLAVHFVTFFQAIKLGGVAVGTLGFACFPAFTTLFEALTYRERPSAAELWSLVAVSLGLVCLTPSFSLNSVATQGLLWAVLSGAVYALVAVVNRRAAATVSGMRACWWQNVVILACLLPFTANALPAVPPLDWLWIACLGLFCTALAYSLYVGSLTALKARQAATIITLEPVYAILMAWALFGAAPGPRTVLGGTLILGAVLYGNRR